jgi:hypothetical protein
MHLPSGACFTAYYLVRLVTPPLSVKFLARPPLFPSVISLLSLQIAIVWNTWLLLEVWWGHGPLFSALRWGLEAPVADR